MGEINTLTGGMIAGDWPNKALELVRGWLSSHRDELQKMWEQQVIEKLPPLD